jgi:hypothetical protein
MESEIGLSGKDLRLLAPISFMHEMRSSSTSRCSPFGGDLTFAKCSLQFGEFYEGRIRSNFNSLNFKANYEGQDSRVISCVSKKKTRSGLSLE